MADDITIQDALQQNQVVATDQIVDPLLGTAHAQFVKLMDGTLGSTNKSTINSAGILQTGDIEARRLLESKLLLDYAATMTALDPAHGFEIR